MSGIEDIPYTDRAQCVLVRARGLAHERRDDCVGSLHVLLAILDEGNGVAAFVLGSNGVTDENVRNQLDEANAETDNDPVRDGGPDDSPLRLLLEAARHEAHRAGDGFVGTEHLLLGMIRIREQPFLQLVSELGLTLRSLQSSVFACLDRTESVQAEPPVHTEQTNRENVNGVPTRRCGLCNATTVSKTPSVLPKCSHCGGVIWVPEGAALPGALRSVATAMRDISEASEKADSFEDLFSNNLATITMVVGASELIIWDVSEPYAPTLHSSHVHVTTNHVLHVQAEHELLVAMAAREIERTVEVCSRDESDSVLRTALFRRIGRLWMIEAILPTGASDSHVSVGRQSLRTIALMLSQSRLIRSR